MSFKSTVFAALAVTTFALPALADGIMVNDPYARSSSAMSTSGAAFMMIMNHSGADDHLLSVASPAAARTELHTHLQSAEGVMQMIHVTEGFPLPKDGMIEMARGGHHVMFMGLVAPMEQGAVIPVTLTFEKAGDVMVNVPVDLTRKPGIGGMNMQHGMAPSN